MTSSRSRTLDELREILSHADRLADLNTREVLSVEQIALSSELVVQMHLWQIEDPAFDPDRVATIVTALRQEEIAFDIANQLMAIEASLAEIATNSYG
ncbi:MAG: hypothetical protein OXN86_14765 [Chloroflexota bacterium]|nr:hypothetical protein [Chloroflexota bacterium]